MKIKPILIISLNIFSLLNCDYSAVPSNPSLSKPLHKPPRATNTTMFFPVGIKNNGNDCFFNTVIQFMMNNPAFLKAALEAGKKQPLYTEFIADYQNAQQQNRPVESKEGTAYRNFRGYLNAKYNGICSDGIKNDSNESLGILIMDIISYGVKSPFQVEMFSQQDKDFINPYLRYAGIDGEDLDNSNLGIELYKQCQDNGTPFLLQFKNAPPNLTFVMSLSPSKKVFSFELPKKLMVTPPVNSLVYDLIYIAIHSGSFSSGHYWCWIKVNDIWYDINDSVVNKIGDTSAALQKFDTLLQSQNIHIMTASYIKN